MDEHRARWLYDLAVDWVYGDIDRLNSPLTQADAAFIHGCIYAIGVELGEIGAVALKDADAFIMVHYREPLATQEE